MTWFIWNIMLALVWVILTGNFTGLGLFAGFVFGYLVLALIAASRGEHLGYIRKVPEVLGFTLYYLWELVKSNVRVAYDVLTPRHHMVPGVIGLPLEAQSDAALTIFANLVTFTPGTLSLDISNDRRMLFIHAMYIEDEERLAADLKDMERRVIKLLS
jgi:multicomponent Na+:H+ antiporter subunit E